jgi:uncharacterized protein YjbI with pentapeptide repeats
VKGWFKAIDNWIYQRRALSLLLAILLTLALVSLLNWATESDLFRQFFFPKACNRNLSATCDALEWKDLFQASLLMLGLPVAFLLWHWRDTNVRDQIEEQRRQVENARLDTNLKEFEEVQLRAAGALDEKLPHEAREQLQIAALHQLRGFLRGDYGESFKRPAFELLLAGHAAAIHRIGVPEVQAQLEDRALEKIQQAVSKLRARLSPVDQSRIIIIRDEAAHIFRAEYPLSNRNFDFVDLQDQDLSGLTLNHSTFNGARLGLSSFENAKFWSVKAIGANFVGAKFSETQAFNSHFVGCDFEGAIFGESQFQRARFEYSSFSNATLFQTHLEDAKFDKCSIDGMRLTEENTFVPNEDFLKVVVETVLPYVDDPGALGQLDYSQKREIFKPISESMPTMGNISKEQKEDLKVRLRKRGAIIDAE